QGPRPTRRITSADQPVRTSAPEPVLRHRVSFGDLANYLAEALDEWSQEVRDAHMQQGLTQLRLAEKLGINQATLSRRLSGRRVVSMGMALTVDQWTQNVIPCGFSPTSLPTRL
ncbi:helix-turn-helix domain-containing protein, partial [Streptomyces chiangmaiensis]